MAGGPSPNLDLRATEICNGRPGGDVTREDPGPFWTNETLRPIRSVLHQPCELTLNWCTISSAGIEPGWLYVSPLRDASDVKQGSVRTECNILNLLLRNGRSTERIASSYCDRFTSNSRRTRLERMDFRDSSVGNDVDPLNGEYTR